MAGLDLERLVSGALVRAGLDEQELPGRAALIARTVAAFERVTGEAPTWGWWVPGRIEIFGKHTDYAGGRSVVAAVPRGIAVVAGPRDDVCVRAFDARWETATDVPLTDLSRAFRGWENYVAVTARRLWLNFPGAALGANLVFASDLPRAAGLSSSSALVVAVATALIQRASLARRDEWAAAIRTPFDLAGYLGAVENGLGFASLGSASGVGTHGGSEDHTAILTAQPGRVRAFAYLPVRPCGAEAFPADWRFIVLSSGVEASKAGEVRERYNRASLAARALAAVWAAHHGGPEAPLAASLGAAGVDAIERAIDARPHPDFPGDALRRRLAHFVAEDGRAPLALEAFARADREVLGDLAARSQGDAAALLENQIPETMRLCELALEAGAFAATSFGAGFGGSVWALADASRAPDIAAVCLDRYRAETDRGDRAVAFVARPGPPLTRVFGAD